VGVNVQIIIATNPWEERVDFLVNKLSSFRFFSSAGSLLLTPGCHIAKDA
jgi:hypothetical protein